MPPKVSKTLSNICVLGVLWVEQLAAVLCVCEGVIGTAKFGMEGSTIECTLPVTTLPAFLLQFLPTGR